MKKQKNILKVGVINFAIEYSTVVFTSPVLIFIDATTGENSKPFSIAYPSEMSESEALSCEFDIMKVPTTIIFKNRDTILD